MNIHSLAICSFDWKMLLISTCCVKRFLRIGAAQECMMQIYLHSSSELFVAHVSPQTETGTPVSVQNFLIDLCVTVGAKLPTMNDSTDYKAQKSSMTWTQDNWEHLERWDIQRHSYHHMIQDLPDVTMHDIYPSGGGKCHETSFPQPTCRIDSSNGFKGIRKVQHIFQHWCFVGSVTGSSQGEDHQAISKQGLQSGYNLQTPYH